MNKDKNVYYLLNNNLILEISEANKNDLLLKPYIKKQISKKKVTKDNLIKKDEFYSRFYGYKKY